MDTAMDLTTEVYIPRVLDVFLTVVYYISHEALESRDIIITWTLVE